MGKAADFMTEKFNELMTTNPEATKPQVFQSGFTAAAVNMRERAMAACDGKTDVNEIKNAIGQLSDIPKK